MASNVKGKHAEIARRYRWHKRKRRAEPTKTFAQFFAELRVRDLNLLFRGRYGQTLPDDDAGREDLRIMAHHLANLAGNPRDRIETWVHAHCPWLKVGEVGPLVHEAMAEPKRWRADTLAWKLRLIEVDRRALGITTIGAVDCSRHDRAKRRRALQVALKRAKRRARGAKSRSEYLASVKAPKPWRELGMSRATWYRRGRPTETN